MNATLTSGWYGSETYTYYVTESGKVWLVQADDVDLSGGPKVVGGLDADAQPLSGSVIDADLAAAVADLD